MSPQFYSLCFYILNDIFSAYQLLQFVITSYSPSFLILNSAKIFLNNFLSKNNKVSMSRKHNVQVSYA